METVFDKLDKKEVKVDMIRDLQDKYRTRLSSSAKVKIYERFLSVSFDILENFPNTLPVLV